MNDYVMKLYPDNSTVSAMTALVQNWIKNTLDFMFIVIQPGLTAMTRGSMRLTSMSDEQLDVAAYS
jgi:hypothetical protein